MKRSDLEKANKLNESLRYLEQLDRILYAPIPIISTPRRNIFWTNKMTGEEISLNWLDKKTADEIKEAIREIIYKREKEIIKELEEL